MRYSRQFVFALFIIIHEHNVLGLYMLSGKENKYVQKNCGKTNPKRGTTKILGGQNTKPNEFPFTVGIFLAEKVPPGDDAAEYDVACSGTLISDRHVLSASHCFRNPEENFKLTVTANDHLYVFVLTTHSRLPVYRERVKAFKVHTNYKKSRGQQDDVALIELAKPLPAKYLSAKLLAWACVPRNGARVPSGLTVVGYGYDPVAEERHLQKAELELWDKKQCYENWNKIKELKNLKNNQPWYLCTHESKRLACQGDSGGGLYSKIQSRYTVFGITSKGTICESAQARWVQASKAGKSRELKGGVAADVHVYADWICRHSGVCP